MHIERIPMQYLPTTLSAALLACVASDTLGGIQKDKMGPPAYSWSFGIQKDKMVTTQGRYFTQDEVVSIENFQLTALGDGFAEHDEDTLETSWEWAFRVDFDARDIGTNAIRSDSFDLSYTLEGGFDDSGMLGAFGGTAWISPNDGTVLGTPLFEMFSAAPGVIKLELDRPLGSLQLGESLTATFLDTILEGENNAALHIAPAFGGDTLYVSFLGQSEWTRVPAPSSIALLGLGGAWLARRRRHDQAPAAPTGTR
jgi:hypothetical protein